MHYHLDQSSVECQTSSDGRWEEHLGNCQESLTAYEPPSPDETDISVEMRHQDNRLAWEYARYHGLCQDYFSFKPGSSLSNLPLPESAEDDLGLTANNAPTSASEKLTIDEATVAILKSAICHVPDGAINIQEPTGRHRLDKLELPLLKSDHEMDLNRFIRQPRPDLSSLVLPFEPVDQESNEGFDWHPSMLELPKDEENKIWKERLQIPKETLIYIKEILDKAEPDRLSLQESSANNLCKVCRLLLLFTTRTNRVAQQANLGPLTPPLTTASFEPFDFGRNSPDISLEFMSEGPDPDAFLLQDIEKQLSEKDSIMVPHHTEKFDGPEIAELYTPLRSIIDNSSPYIAPAKISQLHVEAPLIPPSTENADNHLKATSLAKILGDHHTMFPVWPSSTASNQSADTTILDAIDMIRPFAEAATNCIEQDRLIESDSTMRVDVPIVSFPPILAPWNAIQDLLHQIKMYDLRCFPEWLGTSRLERQLVWRPFPKRLAEVAVEEKIDKLDYLGGILEYMSLEDVATSDSVAWKQEGIRVLDVVEQDDETLEPGDFQEEEKGLDFLVRKRKVE
jgi:hypothetical protein